MPAENTIPRPGRSNPSGGRNKITISDRSFIRYLSRCRRNFVVYWEQFTPSVLTILVVVSKNKGRADRYRHGVSQGKV